jgi:RHS repeat-associated protein
MRIQKSGPLGTTNYLYDGSGMGTNVLEEVDSSGNVLARYAQGPGIDAPLSQLRAGTTSYYEQDGIGSATSLSDGSGVVSKTYAYDSFGKLTASTGTVTNPYQYAGREFDPETGIFYYRARYFDPLTGRFLSEDPLLEGNTSLYAYANNDPVRFFDPWGLMSWDYKVNRKKHGWGILMDASTTVYKPAISIDCHCNGKGKGFTATVKVTFTVDILWGTQGQLAHENGHLAILENYFNGRTQYYSNKYEHIYPSEQDCENASKGIAQDIARDWTDMNKQQEEHEDWMENTIQWIFNKFTGQ